MKVSELMEKLQEFPSDSEVHIIESDGMGSYEVDDLWESTATYGLLTKNPTTVKTVVLGNGWEGL